MRFQVNIMNFFIFHIVSLKPKKQQKYISTSVSMSQSQNILFFPLAKI